MTDEEKDEAMHMVRARASIIFANAMHNVFDEFANVPFHVALVGASAGFGVALAAIIRSGKDNDPEAFDMMIDIASDFGADTMRIPLEALAQHGFKPK